MSIFEKIVTGEIPSHKVWEDNEFLAFLDIRPVAPGHTLVIPKEKVDPVFAMKDDKLQRYFLAAKRVSKLLEKAVPCERVSLCVLGFEVPHAHIHLIPCRSMSDFPWPGGKEADQEKLKELADKIRAR